jgi:hypothetical protein
VVTGRVVIQNTDDSGGGDDGGDDDDGGGWHETITPCEPFLKDNWDAMIWYPKYVI